MPTAPPVSTTVNLCLSSIQLLRMKKLIGSFERVEWYGGDTSDADFSGISRKEHYKRLISDDFTVFRLPLRKNAFDAACLNELFLCAAESRNTRAIN